MFISSRSRQGPHCQAARANWKDLGRRFKRKLLEHFHFYKITHQFLFLLPLELLRSQKALAKTQNKQYKTYPYPLVSFKGRWWQGLSMCPVFASPTRWTTWHLPPTRCLRFRLSRWWLGSSKFWRPGGSCDFLTANVFFQFSSTTFTESLPQTHFCPLSSKRLPGGSSTNQVETAVSLHCGKNWHSMKHSPNGHICRALPPSKNHRLRLGLHWVTPSLGSKPLTLKLKPPAWTNTEQAATRSGPNFHNYVGAGVSQFFSPLLSLKSESLVRYKK